MKLPDHMHNGPPGGIIGIWLESRVGLVGRVGSACNCCRILKQCLRCYSVDARLQVRFQLRKIDQ